MSNFASVRLTRELNKLLSESEQLQKDGIFLEKPEDINLWNITIKGPIDTPYEEGIFKLQIRFEENYPIKPPSIKFLTPMFHPNIYSDGKICIDILQGEWTPAQNIRTIIFSLLSLLMDPNPASPANRTAADLFNKDKKEYADHIRKFVKEHNK